MLHPIGKFSITPHDEVSNILFVCGVVMMNIVPAGKEQLTLDVQ